VCGNGVHRAFGRDLVDRTPTCVSVSSTGTAANATILAPVTMSADGNLVAFRSEATNLDPACAGNPMPLFVRNRASGTTTCVPDAANTQFGAFAFALSANGRVLAFHGAMPGCTGVDPIGGPLHILLRDLVTGATTCGTVNSSGTPGNGFSRAPALSADGRFLVFNSLSTNLAAPCVPSAFNEWHIFVRDTLAGTTRSVSVGNDGLPLPFPAPFVVDLSISADGRFVAFRWLGSAPRLAR